jgi:hypothetical protein
MEPLRPEISDKLNVTFVFLPYDKEYTIVTFQTTTVFEVEVLTFDKESISRYLPRFRTIQVNGSSVLQGYFRDYANLSLLGPEVDDVNGAISVMEKFHRTIMYPLQVSQTRDPIPDGFFSVLYTNESRVYFFKQLKLSGICFLDHRISSSGDIEFIIHSKLVEKIGPQQPHPRAWMTYDILRSGDDDTERLTAQLNSVVVITKMSTPSFPGVSCVKLDGETFESLLSFISVYERSGMLSPADIFLSNQRPIDLNKNSISHERISLRSAISLMICGAQMVDRDLSPDECDAALKKQNGYITELPHYMPPEYRIKGGPVTKLIVRTINIHNSKSPKLKDVLYIVNSQLAKEVTLEFLSELIAEIPGLAVIGGRVSYYYN